MVLNPLEFDDCLTDSPWFRQNLHQHETALQQTYKKVKQVEEGCRELVNAAQKLSIAHRKFAQTLEQFQFETYGTPTDDERDIADSLKEFGRIITQVEDQRDAILERTEKLYIQPLQTFRHDRIGKALHDEKKKFDKGSAKYYSTLEKHLHTSIAKRKVNEIREQDIIVDIERKQFYQASFDYIYTLNSVEERMCFEFVKTLSAFLYSWLSFYHVGHVIHEDFKPYLDTIQIKVDKARTSCLAAEKEAEILKDRMLNSARTMTLPNDKSDTSTLASSSTHHGIKQGYLYLIEKKNIGTTRTKYYCVYQRESRIFTMLPYTAKTQDMRGTYAQSISMKLKSCTRQATDAADKRFCFDIFTDRQSDAMTVQALSEDDRRAWLDSMLLDGHKESIVSPTSAAQIQTSLDTLGVDFIARCISTVDKRGLDEEGVYRVCGVSSKVTKLLQLALDKRKRSSINYDDDREWEVRTVTSAIKTYLRNLPEPLMTYELHNKFINAAKLDNPLERVNHIHYYVYQLPTQRFRVVKSIVEHLKRVSTHSNTNLMNVSNLGVCFGPSLLRPKEETLTAVMDIKFCNVVVEVLIEHCENIFSTKPPTNIDAPRPPKPEHLKEVLIVERADEEERDVLGHARTGHSISPSPSRSVDSTTVPRHSSVARYIVSNGSKSGDVTDSPSHNSLHPAAHPSNSCDSLNSAESNTTSPNRSTDTARPQRGRLSLSYAPAYPGDIWHKRSSTGSGTLSNSLTQLQPNTTFISHQLSAHIAPSRRVRTLYDCGAEHESELSFPQGQIITNVHPSKEPGWLIGTLNGKTGLVPSNYVEPLQ